MNIDLHDIQELFGSILSHQVTQFTVAFGLAAWIHSEKVKKEISEQFNKISESINNIAHVIGNDLQLHKERIEEIESGITKLKIRTDMVSARMLKIEDTQKNDKS